MADRARKYIEITADASKALAELRKLNAATATSEKHLRGIGGAVKDFGYTLRSLGLYLLVDQFIGLADAAANLNSQLLAVTDSAEQADAVFEALLTVANENGVAVDSLAGAFTRLQTALPNVSASNIVETLDLLSTTLAKTGAGTQQANSVMLQFAQGMGSAALQGDEFRAVAENAPTLINAWAASIGKADVAFKDLSASGALTAKSFYENLEAIQAYQDALLGTGPPVLTLGRAFQQLRNNVIALFKDVGEGGGFENLAEAIVSVANGVEMLEVPLNTVIELLGALIELASSVGSVMADLGSSVGSSLAGVADALVGVFSEGEADLINYDELFSYTFQVAIPGYIEDFGYIVEAVWETMRNGLATLISYMVEVWPRVREAGLEAFSSLSTGVQNTIVGMVNYVLEKVQALANNTIGIINGLISGLNSVLPGEGLGLVSGVQLRRVSTEIDAVSTALAKAKVESAAVVKEQQNLRISMDDSLGTLIDTKLAQSEANKTKREDALITKNLKTQTDLATEANEAFATAAKKAGKSSKAAAKEAQKAAVALAKGNKEIEKYIANLEQQITLEGLSKEARAQMEVQLELQTKAQDALNKAQEEALKGNDKVAASYRKIAKAWEDAIPKAVELDKTLRELKKSLKLEDVLEDLGDGFADAFGELFTGGIESAEDFIDELQDVLIGGIKSVISDLSKQAFNVAINAVVNTTGSGTSVTGGGTTSGSGGFSLSSISKFFSGNSLGESISSGLKSGFEFFGGEVSGIFETGINNIANASNLALTAGSILGGLAGSLLFDGKGYSSIGSSIGSTAGSVLAASFALGPVGTVLGGLLGGVGGGFLGSLFGEDDRVPYAQFRVEGGGIRGAGGWGLDEDDMAAAEEYIQSLHDVLTAAGELLGPEAQIARFEFNRAASEEMDPAYIEDYLLGTSREILQAMVDAVPGQLGQLYGAVLNAAGSEFEDVVAALEEISVYITNFAVAIDAIKPGALTNVEDIAGAINQIALADVPAVTAGLVTLAELMESFKTPAEKAADAQARVNAVFEQAGIAVPRTIKEFRALIAALDLTTADGLYASQAISTVAEDLQLLLKVSEDTAAAVDDLGNELSDLDAFIAGLQSEADRNSDALNEILELFSLWGIQMPNTEQALYDLIQAGAFTDAQLEVLAANATKLGYAFSALDQIIADEIDALREAADERIEVYKAESAVAVDLIKAQQQARIDALNDEKDAINDRISEIRDSISGLQSIIDSARKAIFDLGGQAAFGVDENRQRLLDLARSGIESGNLPENVSDIISGLRTVDARDFATREEYLAAVAENQKVLDELAKLGEGQLSEGERQIKLLEEQLDSVDDQIEAIGDQTDRLIAAEEAALAKRIAAEEKALEEQSEVIRNSLQPIVDVLGLIYEAIEKGPGLDDYVPPGGVTPTPVPPAPWAPTAFSDSVVSTSGDTAGQNSQALLASIAATNREMAKLLKRWNGEGMPPDRNDYLLTISENTTP